MMSDCPPLSTTTSRVTQMAKEKEEKRAQERRRNLLYLVMDFLWEQGYTNSTDTLFKEAQLSREIQVCDNINLEMIVQEYYDYYYARFNKYPKLCKKTEQQNCNNVTCNMGWKKDKINKNISKVNDSKVNEENILAKNKSSQKPIAISTSEINPSMTVKPILLNEYVDKQNIVQPKGIIEDLIFDHGKTLKSIKDLYPAGTEWREIADIISKDIVSKDLNVHWNDVKGLTTCKELLKEVIVYPIKYPTLFNKKFGTCKGILLYGPPGTGKTMLAKAVATECQSTFFNITSSSIISKWRGDSEKYVRVLTDLARYYAPTIIFIDEVDWTTVKYGDSSASNSEPSRRFRAELLARLDGLLSSENADVILLTATNVPWNIDVALLRRLEKRIFVDLPDATSRLEILQFYVDENLHDTEQFRSLINKTEGYSCADLKLLCKEAWLNQMRPILKSLESRSVSADNIQSSDVITKLSYIMTAMSYVKPITKHMKEHYIKWNKECGSFE